MKYNTQGNPQYAKLQKKKKKKKKKKQENIPYTIKTQKRVETKLDE